jgi:ankyrin repeat protein
MRAAISENVKIMKLLLSRNASIMIKDMKECTSMHHAALKNHLLIIKLLLEHETDFEVQDNDD